MKTEEHTPRLTECFKAIVKENTEAIIINLPEFLLWAFVSSLECFPEAVVLQVSDL